MITISSVEFDPLGFIPLQELPDSDMVAVARRVNRVATLDGGVVVNDGGYAAGDRTLRLKWRIKSHAEYAKVSRLLRLHHHVRVVSRDGIFLTVPKSLNEQNSVGDLTLLVIEEII